jgi:hypothetical protein
MVNIVVLIGRNPLSIPAMEDSMIHLGDCLPKRDPFIKNASPHIVFSTSADMEILEPSVEIKQ